MGSWASAASSRRFDPAYGRDLKRANEEDYHPEWDRSKCDSHYPDADAAAMRQKRVMMVDRKFILKMATDLVVVE